MYFQNFDIKLSQENEEDYTISQIEDARDREKTDIVLQSISSSTNPHFLSVSKFKAALANNSDIAEKLFELLQAQEDNQDDVWEVLTLLP